jgi:hypothetical protein
MSFLVTNYSISNCFLTIKGFGVEGLADSKSVSVFNFTWYLHELAFFTISYVVIGKFLIANNYPTGVKMCDESDLTSLLSLCSVASDDWSIY